MRRARPAPAPAAPAHESIRIGGVVGDQETAPAARGRRYHGRGPRFTPKARALSMAVGLGGKLEHVPDLITGWCEHPNVMSTGRSTCTGTGGGNVEANFSHGPFSTHTINGVLLYVRVAVLYENGARTETSSYLRYTFCKCRSEMSSRRFSQPFIDSQKLLV